jgi:hypothetical protein
MWFHLLNEQYYQCEAVVSNIKDNWIQMHTWGWGANFFRSFFFSLPIQQLWTNLYFAKMSRTLNTWKLSRYMGNEDINCIV